MEISNERELLSLPGGVDSVLSHTGPHFLPVVWQERLGLPRKYAQFHIWIWLEKYSPPQSIGGEVCEGVTWAKDYDLIWQKLICT